jgi:hypothetical protein
MSAKEAFCRLFIRVEIPALNYGLMALHRGLMVQYQPFFDDPHRCFFAQLLNANAQTNCNNRR